MRPSDPPTDQSGTDPELASDPPAMLDLPPEAVKAIALQRQYWTFDAAELARLQSADPDQLTWPQRLRMHHLLCSQLIGQPGEETAVGQKCRESLHLMTAPDSPYRPRIAVVWQGDPPKAADPPRPPDLQGEFCNPSLTHLGCVEILTLDQANQPAAIEFVPFDDLSGIVFAQPTLLRAAKLFYEGGRTQIAMLPMIYGLTWSHGSQDEQAGTLTRFVSHLRGERVGGISSTAIGLGQQDMSVQIPGGGASVLGLTSVAQIGFPLDMRDPRFDEKARGRGVDPDEARRQAG